VFSPGRRRRAGRPSFVVEIREERRWFVVAGGRTHYMPEQRENSVLFSLKELRRIEDDRIRQEETDARARVEAERKAREDAERKAREDVERRHREEEDRIRRGEQEKVAREREEQMRLAEAERRHRVEAEMRLQEERMRLEVHARKGKSPLPAIIVVGCVVVALAGGIIYKLHADAEADKIAMQHRVAEETARQERELREAQDKQRRLEALIAQKERDLKEAKTEEERSRIRGELERAQERKRAAPGRTRDVRTQDTAASKPSARPIKKRDFSDNPLDGLKL
jgi:colicin import membrane protein